jgi:hypothetical protein
MLPSLQVALLADRNQLGTEPVNCSPIPLMFCHLKKFATEPEIWGSGHMFGSFFACN